MHPHVHLPDRAAASEAADLIDRFGAHAAGEGEGRAGRSRAVGELLAFCRWRQIERLILVLALATGARTIH